MTKQIFKVDETEAGARVDNYLSALFDNYSRTKIQSLIKSALVFINGKPCKPSQTVNTDDEIICDFDEAEDIKILPENIPLDIQYEDEYLAVVNKPSGMLTHPTSNEKTGTLVNALLYKYGNNLSDINGPFRRGIVHRLDRNTSGLLIIAKTNETHEKIADMIKQRLIEKHYRTIVKGRITQDMVIEDPIARSKTQPNKMCVSPDGKPSLTEISVLENFENETYLDVNLKTGRTHQIRVHLSHIGHPVYNDTMYGFGKMKIKTDEQVLQSYLLRFNHPFSDKVIDVKIEPDEKVNKILNYLRNKGENK